jgi:hypothetical protein
MLLLWLALGESGALDVGDVFWHLRTGDLILDDGLPSADPFSWTAGGSDWQPNAWLGDVLWALIRDAVGAVGISLLGGITVLGVALLLYRNGRHEGAGPWAAAAASGAALIFMAPFIAPRPLLIGFVLAPIAVAGAGRFREGSIGGVVTVAAVVLAWSNLHGSFVTGVGMVGLIAVGWAIDDRTAARPAALAATAVIAGLVNPFGVSAYLHTLDIRDESSNIDEWQPLAFDDVRGILLVVFMAAAAWALVAAARRARRVSSHLPGRFWEQTLLLGVLAVLTFAVIRTGAFFLIAAAPIVAAGLTNSSAEGLRRWSAPRRGPLLTGLMLAGLLLAAQQAPELADAGDPGPRFSEQVVAAIPDTCILLNEYDLGGFVIDRRWPNVLVSQDGRNDLYGADEIERQEELLASSDPERIEDTGITCVLADRDRPAVRALGARPGWRVVKESAQLVLLARDRP